MGEFKDWSSDMLCLALMEAMGDGNWKRAEELNRALASLISEYQYPDHPA